MANSVFFVALLVLILAVLYVMKGGDHPPETGYTQTPRQYIEQVERKKAARKTAEALQQSLQESADKADRALEEASRAQR